MQPAAPTHSKPLLRRIGNRVFHLLARFCPGATTVRPRLHRLRGVKVGSGVFIGEDVYIDNEYPEAIEIGDGVQISIRALLIAHTRGSGKIIVGRQAFIGPNAVVICGANRVLTIGDGAVVGAGSVVTRSVPAGLYVAPPAPQPLARARIPLPAAETMEEFQSGLEKLGRGRRGG
jgi:serine acetyltransferase